MAKPGRLFRCDHPVSYSRTWKWNPDNYSASRGQALSTFFPFGLIALYHKYDIYFHFYSPTSLVISNQPLFDKTYIHTILYNLVCLVTSSLIQNSHLFTSSSGMASIVMLFCENTILSFESANFFHNVDFWAILGSPVLANEVQYAIAFDERA